jgi:hypothetical protein
MAIIFIFADGIGLAPSGADNPLSVATTPSLRAVLGGPLTIEQIGAAPGILLRAIDANLGIAGLPQSGTGQAALFGGFNAAELHGRHQPHLPPIALRPRLAAENMFHHVQALGKSATFANVFGPNYWIALESGRLRKSASVIAAEGAGLRLRTIEDLRAGAAIPWDVTGQLLQAREPVIDRITPTQAGSALANLAESHDLVFYETFLPDLAAHNRLSFPAVANRESTEMARHGIEIALTLIDQLIGATLAAMQPTDTLLLTSDHGNAESLSAKSHTRNPVPLLAIGPAANAFAQVEDLTQIAAAIAAALGEAH